MNEPRIGVAVFVVRQGAPPAILIGQRKGSHGAGTHSIPGGHVEPGETPAEAAARELAEETGIEVFPAALIDMQQWTFTTFPDGRAYVTLYFAAIVEAHTEAKTLEPKKCAGWRWYMRCEHLPMPLFTPLQTLLARHGGWPEV